MPEITVQTIGAEITISGDGFQKMAAAINAANERSKNLTQPFNDFRPFWQENERTLFAAEGVPQWPALSPAYAARKAVLYPGKTILRRTDRLYFSLAADSAESIYTAGPKTLRMGTNVPYSKYHTQRRPHVQLLNVYWDKLNELVFLYIDQPFQQP